MNDRPPETVAELGSEEEELEPLVPEDTPCGEAELEYAFDEFGEPVDADEVIRPGARPVGPIPPEPLRFRPCSLTTLNGSWLLQLTPQFPFANPFQEIRGPMRIEAGAGSLRISGDIYLRRVLVAAATEPASPLHHRLLIGKNWYPAFPQSEYRWYFRSRGVTYSKGVLSFPFERRLWDVPTQEFTGLDRGSMRLTCTASLIRPPWAPQPTIQMKGSAVIGGRRFDVTATKTSPFHRGCRVEVDAMSGRQWPATALACGSGSAVTFAGVYRAAGMDFTATVNELNVPADPVLTTAEMHTLLATHQAAPATGDHSWRLWLLVGSADQQGNFGIMFDQVAPHRQGAVGFADPTLPVNPMIEAGAQGQALGNVPLAFLRTLIHEAGHAFNLFHPKHDIHAVPVGTTIMNQTGDVISFATAANPYPCTATMGFDDHNRTSLIHSPDPQVKPGWKQFGWGHSSTFAGVGEPTDAAGLQAAALEEPGLRVELELPQQAQRGEFVVAAVTVRNTGEEPRQVSAALNLAEGDLWLSVVTPAGQRLDVRDVVLACGPQRLVELAPGDHISGQIELLYTSTGVTFDQPGKYSLHAEYDTGDPAGEVIRSNTAEVVVRPATSEDGLAVERLATDDDVGLAFALGDYGAAPETFEKLDTLMREFGESDTGAASAMVIANSAARPLRDLRADEEARSPDTELVQEALEIALSAGPPEEVARLAAAVVSPIEPEAPLLELVGERVSGSEEAEKILEDLRR